ncbi:uncharacterized protein LOC143191886 [Rhynchophorus ferrugineus]|uniref:Secreted protein n=1 Tax=Rhynchophorus ferrugineus TaxID=354439 RepID=A0A834IU59_RHYFE|nr:hypothetical protein GWI33_002089 [Rhynchophorus ferrugineus]
MKLLVVAVVALALFSAAVCDDEHGEEGGYEGGYGGGEVSEEGGDGDHATPIVHEGHVVSHVFGAPQAPGYFHVPIPDIGFDRYVIHKPGHAHPLVKKGEGFGYSHHHH